MSKQLAIKRMKTKKTPSISAKAAAKGANKKSNGPTRTAAAINDPGEVVPLPVTDDEIRTNAAASAAFFTRLSKLSHNSEIVTLDATI